MQGRFLTFEGIDGAGKTSRINALEAHLAAKGVKTLRTREPGGTPLGEKIRGLLLSEDMGVDAETLLFFAARAEHVERVIKPALAEGVWVLSDRFTDATYAYQAGGKGVPGERVEAIEAWTLGGFQPDATFLFDIDPAIAEARRGDRGEAADRFEREKAAFFHRVRDAYLERARRQPERFVVLNAADTPEAIEVRMFEETAKWL